ncbi:hypothetical protein HOP62_01075 [Halomonas sp. MCCC 1A17488]|uniref:Uncharacterized protein n=1 Tax=Billgrantia sulfidoxydans TaxID=2733484 RepID=A0ABX7W570_9GAMM|nr:MULTISPECIES: hypothetical protein [Halomonas]MCE8014664.1 hypothetical protein [Halomonas sp. MCCC 1A17488]MCG3237997.1 hypothetical protein [Halomonas sp. MCCC 1A17488]QPP48223.1 hypothetical protein I4484_13325 [Halomonas sp. SS10-MC5]QTP55523.1 hypothetical protein HNO51_13010 [Halomonas sulfidoxydans]
MTKIPDAILSVSGLALLLLLPLNASANSLSVPGDAIVAVQVIDDLILDGDSGRRDDILLRPVGGQDGTTHELPEYCVVVGDARQDGDRLRIAAKALTCVETEGGDSDIYNGEISAAAYDSDGSYGLAVCDAGRCELASDHVFHLQLASQLEIEEQDNPSARINEQRRQSDGAGVANPIPAERPDPDSD